MPTYPVDAVVRYGDEPEQLADVRLPHSREPTALIVLVHGGFWRQEYDRHHTDQLAIDLVQRGYAVASLEYRRVGGAGGWPHTFEDIATAVDQVPGLVADVRPGPAARRPTDLPVVLLGHSAGGHLALWASGRHQLPSTSAWHLSQPSELAGVVALAPVADLAYAHELGLGDGAVADLLGAAGPGWADRLAQADPSRLPPDAPVVLVHGDQDRHVPLEVSRRYAEHERSRGAEVALDVLASTEHFALIDQTSAAWKQVLAAVASLTTSASTSTSPSTVAASSAAKKATETESTAAAT